MSHRNFLCKGCTHLVQIDLEQVIIPLSLRLIMAFPLEMWGHKKPISLFKELLVVPSIDSVGWEEMILRKFGKLNLNVIALDYLKNQADVCYPSQSIVHVNVWKHLPNSSGRCWLLLYCLSHCSRMNWVEACYDGTCFESSVGRNNGCVWLWDMGLPYLVFELLPKNSLLLLS